MKPGWVHLEDVRIVVRQLFTGRTQRSLDHPSFAAIRLVTALRQGAVAQ
jgi:hypothetical protein